MRALLSFVFSPSRQSATLTTAGLEPRNSNRVEYYRAVLAEIANYDRSSMRPPMDLPESIQKAIDAWEQPRTA
jgi:hypothetical protein